MNVTFTGIASTPKPPTAFTVTRVRRFVRKYRKHGERRGVVRRDERIVADLESADWKTIEGGGW
jgi:hypothetical protein